jgi:hypothetical protein
MSALNRVNPNNVYPYSVSYTPIERPKTDIVDKVVNYTLEIFKILPTISSWLKVADVTAPPLFGIIGSALSIASSCYSIYKDIKCCIESKNNRELTLNIFSTFKDIFYLAFALIALITQLCLMKFSPIVAAVLGTIVLIVSLTRFFYKECAPKEKQPEYAAKIEIKFPVGTPEEEMRHMHAHLKEAAKREASRVFKEGVPTRPPLLRADSF